MMRVSEKKRGEDGDKEVKGKRKTWNNKRENEGDVDGVMDAVKSRIMGSNWKKNRKDEERKAENRKEEEKHK